MRFFCTAAAAILLCCNLFSQSPRRHTTNYNGWYMFFGSFKFSEKLGLHAEVQWRRYNYILDNQQLLLRGGLNWHFNKQVMGTAGYCFVETYPYGEFASKIAFPEHRIWEQLQFGSRYNRLEMVSRFRLEQRYVYSPVLKDSIYVVGKDIYSNRFRLLTRFSVPFKGETIADKTFYITAYEEIFINFGENVAFNIFDQNRAYIALGYKIPKLGKLELGYLNQMVFRGNGIQVENNHTLQVSLTSTFNFYKAN
jgi:hypothetical protein